MTIKKVLYREKDWRMDDIETFRGFEYGYIDTDKISILGMIKFIYLTYNPVVKNKERFYREIILANRKIVIASQYKEELLIEGWDESNEK